MPSTPTDTTRREALARSLAARICDERLALADLIDLDRHLTNRCAAIELFEVLADMELAVDDARDHHDRSYRVGWRDALVNVRRRLQLELGLAELVAAAPAPQHVDKWPSLDEIRGGEG